MKKKLTHLATRVFDTPLMIHKGKLDVILTVLGPRFHVETDELLEVQANNGAHREEMSNTSIISMEQPSVSVNLAVIPICGTLVNRAMGLDAMSGLTTYAELSDQLNAALNDDSINAIVLDIDSPGGEVNGVFDLAGEIYEARKVKPVYAVANEYAFSAAYLLASAANKVYLPKTGNLGSIGVISVHVDQSEADKQDGLKYSVIFAGDYKADFNSHAPLSDRAKGRLQQDVDELYGMFTETVATYRGLSVQQVVNTKAATFLGKSAVSAGLADEVMSVTDSLNAIIQEVVKMKEDKTTAPAAAAPAPAAAASAPAPAAVVTDPPAPAAAAPAPVAAEPARDFSLEAADISEACAVGGMPQLAAEFIRRKLTPAQAKAELFDRKARGEPTISSAAAPDAGGGPDADPAGEGEKLLKGAMEKINKNQSLADRGDNVKLW